MSIIHNMASITLILFFAGSAISQTQENPNVRYELDYPEQNSREQSSRAIAHLTSTLSIEKGKCVISASTSQLEDKQCKKIFEDLNQNWEKRNNGSAKKNLSPHARFVKLTRIDLTGKPTSLYSILSPPQICGAHGDCKKKKLTLVQQAVQTWVSAILKTATN